MLATLAFAALLTQQEGITYSTVFQTPTIFARVRQERLDPPKYSPKNFTNDEPWEFDWLTQGYVNLKSNDVQSPPRFRIYSQERKAEHDKAPMVARMALRMWEHAHQKLHIDHSMDFNSGIVDFYLCFGGNPGGEQVFGHEMVRLTGEELRVADVKVNTIYIYDLRSFTNDVEMAREVAHEYGHAVLPAVGGFKLPEPWGNGYLGEKLFLKYFRDEMSAKRFTSDDAMGATLGGLDAWVKKNVDPLVLTAATRFPDSSFISEGQAGMDAFNGMALYVEATCPPAVFMRAIIETASGQRATTDSMKPPTEFAANVVTAASEMPSLALDVPPMLRDKKIWIPLGKGTCSGATVLSRKSGWAEVAPLTQTIVIKNPALEVNLHNPVDEAVVRRVAVRTPLPSDLAQSVGRGISSARFRYRISS